MLLSAVGMITSEMVMPRKLVSAEMLWGWKPRRVYAVFYLDTDSRLLVLIEC